MFILLTNSLSAHQLPLARELAARMGAANFRYVYTEQALQGGNQEVAADEPWIERIAPESLEDDSRLVGAETLLVGGLRPLALMERRVASERTTLYMTERWFKPIGIGGVLLPGWLRLLHLGYFRMARRFARLFASPAYRFLPIGPWALADMRLLCRVCGVKIPESQVVPWGYFVVSSAATECSCQSERPKDAPLRVLWVGRRLGLKHVETIEKAVKRLQAEGLSVTFDTFSTLTLDEVRAEMRAHDVYVLASDAREGWGAALSEAMVEGMVCLGTHEAGASAALLPASHRFPAGDVRQLAALLRACAEGRLGRVALPETFTPKGAAERVRLECTR